jgi:tRNA(Ile)-lysidine synthase
VTAGVGSPIGDPAAVRRAVASWLAAGHVAAEAPLIVACSGGADSLALAVATVQAAPGRRLVGATVDHGLQPGSAARAGLVVETLRNKGFERVRTLAVTVDGPGGPEAAARDARYRALLRLVAETAPDAAVLLAHTADDQAETVLLGLARGSGPRSIAGMTPWRPPWGRPLLGLRRADTEAACAADGLVPWQDPHNVDPAYTRVRLRREVIPLLDEVLGGGVIPALARTADLLADDLSALDLLARPVAAEAIGDDGWVGIAALLPHPPAIRRRVLRAWAGAAAGSLTADHLYRLDALATAGRTGQSVRLPGGVDAVRRRDRLVLVPVGSPT